MSDGELEKDKRVERKVRTRISLERKEVLKAFSNKDGWMIRNCNKEEIIQVCSTLEITRSNLKSWMKNNKKKMMFGQQ